MRFIKQALLVALPGFVYAQGDTPHLVVRQTTSGSATPTSTTSSFSVKLAATNPTAVPLTQINSLQPSSVTKALQFTGTPGSIPTFLSGAPPLPTITRLQSSDYPPPDHPAPTDSPEVAKWIQEVKDTGIVIPDILPTDSSAGCGGVNAAAAADKSRCWWTCSGCTRSTDVSTCPTRMDWGLTYDDGPSFYTPNLLEYLEQEKIKATFFVVGSRVFYNWDMLQSQYMNQHQIAIHSWSHFPLTTLSNEQIIAELGWSKKIIKDVLGVTPNMMRPPYGDIDDRVRAISLAMGLTPVMWTRVGATTAFNTEDFYIKSGSVSVQQVLQNWENIIGNATTMSSGFIVLEHDLYLQAVEVATGYILPDALAHKPPFGIKPVVTCLQKSMSEAYIETNDNSTNTPPLQAAISSGVVTTTSVAGAKSTSPANSNIQSTGTNGVLSLAGLAVGGLLVAL